MLVVVVSHSLVLVDHHCKRDFCQRPCGLPPPSHAPPSSPRLRFFANLSTPCPSTGRRPRSDTLMPIYQDRPSVSRAGAVDTDSLLHHADRGAGTGDSPLPKPIRCTLDADAIPPATGRAKSGAIPNSLPPACVSISPWSIPSSASLPSLRIARRPDLTKDVGCEECLSQSQPFPPDESDFHAENWEGLELIFWKPPAATGHIPLFATWRVESACYKDFFTICQLSFRGMLGFK